jgi:hypothetical protein
MPDANNIPQLIAYFYTECSMGDVHTKNQFLPILLTNIELALREKIRPLEPAVSRVRTRLHVAVEMMLSNNHPLPAWDTKREDDIKLLMNYFDKFAVRINGDVSPQTETVIDLIADVESICFCMNGAFNASEDYSRSLCGDPAGLTRASNKYGYLLSIITPILYRWNLLNINVNDMKQAALNAATRNAEAQERARQG